MWTKRPPGLRPGVRRAERLVARSMTWEGTRGAGELGFGKAHRSGGSCAVVDDRHYGRCGGAPAARGAGCGHALWSGRKSTVDRPGGPVVAAGTCPRIPFRHFVPSTSKAGRASTAKTTAPTGRSEAGRRSGALSALRRSHGSPHGETRRGSGTRFLGMRRLPHVSGYHESERVKEGNDRFERLLGVEFSPTLATRLFMASVNLAHFHNYRTSLPSC